MFDNVAFNVVIGLVFIYLLYSLLVTIIGEYISNKFGIRARLLRIALERMLNDGYLQKIERKKNKWWQGWLRKYFLYEADEFKNSFAGRFYEYPPIKYLGRIEEDHKGLFSSTKPSYISANYFADTLIKFLEDKGAGATVMDKVGFCLKFNTYHIQPKTLKQFRNLYEGAGGNIEIYKQNIINWFNETMDRATGWHKRKMRAISFMLGMIIAASFNVDSIRIAKSLANDKEARNQLVNMGVELSKDSARYKDFVNSKGDTVHSYAIVDTGLSRITKDINDANVILGLGWGFSDSLKSDNISVSTNDSSNLLLQKRVDSLDGLIQRKNNITDHFNASLIRLEQNKKSLDSLKYDTIIAKSQALLAVNDDSLKSIWQARLASDTNLGNRLNNEANIILAEMRQDSGALAANTVLNKMLYSDINKLSGKKYVRIDSIDRPGEKGVRFIYGKRQYDLCEKTGFILGHIFWYNLMGFLITALALSLGAPFWFDLLNKLVAIRGVGVKPEEKKKTEVPIAEQNPADKNILTRDIILKDKEPISDVVAAALKNYAVPLKRIPGVKSVFTVVKNSIKQLQINVDNAATKAEVINQFPRFPVGNIEVPFSIVESGIPISHAGQKGVIANRSGKNGFGTLGCILVRKDTGSKHILSCWHVLKGDLNYSGSDDEPFIIDHESGKELAERWAGGIRDQFDYGLAICLQNSTYRDNSFLKNKLGLDDKIKITFRFVSQADIDHQIPVNYYDSLDDTIKQGLIYTDSAEVDINYIDKTRTIKDVLILTDENEQSISKEGNSGSIVFDEKKRAIAMIIAGDLNYTYAVKLSNIFSIHTEMNLA